MSEKKVVVSRDGLTRLHSAALDFAKVEITRIVQAVIDDLRSRPAEGVFGEVGARHLWDEYCWSLQEGPFDDDMSFDDLNIGSLSSGFDDVVRACVQAEVQKLPKHAQIFLSARAFEEASDSDEENNLGAVSLGGIVNTIMELLNERASRRKLDLIGPNRGDEIGYEIKGTGFVWSVLSGRDEATELIAGHADRMIDPKANLSAVADEMVEGFMIAAKDDPDGTILGDFLERFEKEIRRLLKENDVLPSLEDMRAGLVERLDG